MAAPRPTGCPRCDAPLVEIRLAPGGSELALRSCSRCDARWWLRDGELTDFGRVLSDVRRQKKPVARTA
jgi:Zn-finger nucleic acid-binding protein